MQEDKNGVKYSIWIIFLLLCKSFNTHAVNALCLLKYGIKDAKMFIAALPLISKQ